MPWDLEKFRALPPYRLCPFIYSLRDLGKFRSFPLYRPRGFEKFQEKFEDKLERHETWSLFSGLVKKFLAADELKSQRLYRGGLPWYSPHILLYFFIFYIYFFIFLHVRTLQMYTHTYSVVFLLLCNRYCWYGSVYIWTSRFQKNIPPNMNKENTEKIIYI